jgi:hypothetical protein
MDDVGGMEEAVGGADVVSLTAASVVRVSDDVVARRIEGEIIIVPLAAGIGDLEDELYTLNPTGQAIWDLLDGSRSLGEIAAELGCAYTAGAGEVERDVIGLVGELVRRRMLVVV